VVKALHALKRGRVEQCQGFLIKLSDLSEMGLSVDRENDLQHRREVLGGRRARLAVGTKA